MKVKSTVVPVVVFSNLVTSLVVPSLERDTKSGVVRRGPHRETLRSAILHLTDCQKLRRPVPPASPSHLPYADSSEEDSEFSDEEAEHETEDGGDVDHYLVKSNEEGISPLFVNGQGSALIPHRYIVVFKEGVLPEEVDFHMETVAAAHMQSLIGLEDYHPFFRSTRDGVFRITAISPEGGIQHKFEVSDKFKGYVGYFTDELVKLIRWNPLVQFVEQDSVVEATEFDTQNGATWGLARISHRERLNLGSFNKYLYDDEAGEGVTSYVVDTGINIDHVDFEGRAIWGKTIPNNDADYDGNGHGTHCAGTIASKTYGVAKKAEVVAVKVLRSNGTGSMSDVLKGVEYVAQAHKKAVKENKKGFKGSTANMSLGGGRSPALDLAVDAAVSAGVHFAVAAGNENQNACNTSPAGSKKAITVGASTLADERAYFSNWGKCVDVFAPGLNILSTYIGSDSAVATLSGTSMASPHVAGLLTYFLSLQPGNDSDYGSAKPISPDVLKSKLLAYSSPDVLRGLPQQTPNKLVYNGGGKDLSDFWGKNPSELQTNSQQGIEEAVENEVEEGAADYVAPGVQNLLDRVESGTDYLFSELRNLLDGLNII